MKGRLYFSDREEKNLPYYFKKINKMLQKIFKYFEYRRKKKELTRRFIKQAGDIVLHSYSKTLEQAHESLKDETFEISMSDIPIERCTPETKRKIHKLVLADIKKQTEFKPRTPINTGKNGETGHPTDEETWLRLEEGKMISNQKTVKTKNNKERK